jgi:hypothetical protein
VISTSLNGTTARLLEYTMTPRFFNSYSRGLTTIQEFEGLVLSQLMYTSYPCEDEEDEMLIIAPYGDYNLVNPTTGTTSGINLINTGFLSGSYSGTTFSGTSPASPGSGGENDPSTFPNFTDGLGNFFNSVGSAFSDAYEWTGNTIRTIFRWIRNLFCGSCSPRSSMARGPADPIIIIDDNAPPATTPTPLEPCDWFYSNFALFQVNTLVGYNPNNDLTPEVLNWWDNIATDPTKVSLLNYLNSEPFINQNTWQVFFQLVNYLLGGGNQNFANDIINYLLHYDDVNIVEVDLNNRILIDESFKNNVKAYSTYNKLKQTNTFSQLLLNFEGDNSLIPLTFKVGNVANCAGNGDPNGCTQLKYDQLPNGNAINGVITITIDENYINSQNTPILLLGKTIVHEAIHANISYYIYVIESGGDPNNSNFTTAYEAYRATKGWQHNYMANFYLNTMQDALAQLHPLIGDQTFINYMNNSFPNIDWYDFYLKISISGLHNTTYYNNLPQEVKDLINIYLYDTRANSIKTISN